MWVMRTFSGTKGVGFYFFNEENETSEDVCETAKECVLGGSYPNPIYIFLFFLEVKRFL